MVSQHRTLRHNYRELLFSPRHEEGSLKLRRRDRFSQKAEETRVNCEERYFRDRQCHVPRTCMSEGQSTASSVSFLAVTTLPSHLLVAPSIDIQLSGSHSVCFLSRLSSLLSFLKSLLIVLVVVSIVHLSSSFLQDPASFFIQDTLSGLLS